MTRPNDEQNPEITPGPDSLRTRRGWSFQLAALGLIAISALAGTGLAYYLKQSAPQTKKTETEGKKIIPARLFQNWGQPDFVIVLSAQQQGYIMPCGCSQPQVGGLERRYNFIQLLKNEKGWKNVVAVDLGDIPQKAGPANLANVQGLIKYRYSMMALKDMGYLAVGIGEHEANGSWSLEKIEGEWAANEPRPAVLANNLKNAANVFPFLKTVPETYTVPDTNIKVGVSSIVGYSIAKQIRNKAVQFNVPSQPGIQEQLDKMHAEKVDLPILLYHGYATGNQEAIRCAQTFPDVPIILALTEEDEPPASPDQVNQGNGNRNYVFRLGHKGKYIGVIGVYRNGPNFRFNYQLVKLTENYATPEDQKANNPIAKKWEDYTRELKRDNYLAKYNQSSHTLQVMDEVKGLRNPEKDGPHYIGSEVCKKCHDHAYEVWKESKHSHAYQTLVDAKHPSLRQYDGECIVCHTVGFGYRTGFTDEVTTAKLKNVGCESCHGPGSLHAKNPENQEWRDRMNQPWRDARSKGDVKAKNAAIEKFCVTCHDIDNDVHWVHQPGKDPFKEKWIDQKIIHNKPPE